MTLHSCVSWMPLICYFLLTEVITFYFEFVVELGRKIGVDLKKEDISTSYRLPSKVKANGERALFPPAIIICEVYEPGCSRETLSRQDIASQDLGFSEENRIFINENLTQSNNELFKACLKVRKVKKDKGFKFLQTNGG